MDVKIYTFADKRPDFIAWQAETFSHFLTDPYELVVVNNGSSPELSRQIRDHARSLGLSHVEIIDKHHENPNVACAYPIDWVIKNCLVPDKDVRNSIIIDSDMFLVKKFSALDFVGDYEIAALPQRRGHVRYIWNGIVFINHRTIRDLDQVSFHCSGCWGYCPGFDTRRWRKGKIEGQGVDVGGDMYFYFKGHPGCKVKYLFSTHHITPERKNLNALPSEILSEYDAEFAFELIEQKFFHYGSGSNWKNQPKDYHSRKTQFTDQFLRKVVNGSIVIPDLVQRKNYVDPGFRYSQYFSTMRYFLSKMLRSKG